MAVKLISQDVLLGSDNGEVFPKIDGKRQQVEAAA
jgi:hypothetical protein